VFWLNFDRASPYSVGTLGVPFRTTAGSPFTTTSLVLTVCLNAHDVSLFFKGRIWLGECAVCRNHDNEGFLRAYENTTPTCGHPLCQECADHILRTTRACPKCRRLAASFLRVHMP
jgi:hypothetical protein